MSSTAFWLPLKAERSVWMNLWFLAFASIGNALLRAILTTCEENCIFYVLDS
jgi:hypothetical protein